MKPMSVLLLLFALNSYGYCEKELSDLSLDKIKYDKKLKQEENCTKICIVGGTAVGACFGSTLLGGLAGSGTAFAISELHFKKYSYQLEGKRNRLNLCLAYAYKIEDLEEKINGYLKNIELYSDDSKINQLRNSRKTFVNNLGTTNGERIIFLYNKKFSIEDEIFSIEKDLLSSILNGLNGERRIANDELVIEAQSRLQKAVEINRVWIDLSRRLEKINEDINLIETEMFAIDSVYSFMKI